MIVGFSKEDKEEFYLKYANLDLLYTYVDVNYRDRGVRIRFFIHLKDLRLRILDTESEVREYLEVVGHLSVGVEPGASTLA